MFHGDWINVTGVVYVAVNAEVCAGHSLELSKLLG